MNTVGEPSRNLFDELLEQVRQVVREAVREELGTATNRSELDADGLMDVTQAADCLRVTPSWVYKNASRLPFAKKVGGALRFDGRGMRRWLENQRR
jgi:Helix-turn-helix domain